MLGNGTLPYGNNPTEKERVLQCSLDDMADRNLELTQSRDFWKLKYLEQKEETRKANRGVQRLSYWKQKNKRMIEAVKKQQWKHKPHHEESWIDKLVGANYS